MASKLFKISYSKKKYAIPAGSLDELVLKSKKKFNIDTDVNKISFYMTDGTEIDHESFMYLKEETVLIIVLEGELIEEKREEIFREPTAVPRKRLKFSENCNAEFSRSGNIFRSLMNKTFFVDKSEVIRSVINLYMSNEKTEKKESPISIIAPRRFGKTANLDLLEAFFGGQVSKEEFLKLKIGQDEEALGWYNKFTVIYISFGSCLDVVKSRDDSIRSCRLILHTAFRTYSHILHNLDLENFQAFRKWIDEEDYKDKTEEDVFRGLRFLVECIRSHTKRDVCLLIDEFDKICTTAIFRTNETNLGEIIDFYCGMVAQVVKFDPISAISIFSGITLITSQALSSLNNPINIEVLRDENFFRFYGIMEMEFEELMGRENIPKNVKDLKHLAYKWYNGYSYKDVKIFNTFSIVNFIILQTVKLYWRRSGAAKGLWEALNSESSREKIHELINGATIEVKLIELCPEHFSRISDGRYEVIDPNFILVFLLQQGYLTMTKAIGNKTVHVKIPNEEVRGVYHTIIAQYYEEIFKFDPTKMEKLFKLFDTMNLSKQSDCKKKLKSFKNILIELVNTENEVIINEAWLEAFIFAIFFQYTEVQQQVKVKRTPKNNDMRTAKVLDLIVEIRNNYFIFEETLIDSGAGALKKILKKGYYKHVKDDSQFVLIGIGFKNKADISISFLVNSINEKDSEVL